MSKTAGKCGNNCGKSSGDLIQPLAGSKENDHEGRDRSPGI